MWVRLVVVAVATVGASACIIGPKQDDPATLSSDKNVEDTSLGASDTATATPSDDTSPGLFVDSAVADVGSSDTGTVPPPADTGCATDAADASDAGETGCQPADAAPTDVDGGSDAVSDG